MFIFIIIDIFFDDKHDLPVKEIYSWSTHRLRSSMSFWTAFAAPGEINWKTAPTKKKKRNRQEKKGAN